MSKKRLEKDLINKIKSQGNFEKISSKIDFDKYVGEEKKEAAKFNFTRAWKFAIPCLLIVTTILGFGLNNFISSSTETSKSTSSSNNSLVASVPTADNSVNGSGSYYASIGQATVSTYTSSETNASSIISSSLSSKSEDDISKDSVAGDEGDSNEFKEFDGYFLSYMIPENTAPDIPEGETKEQSFIKVSFENNSNNINDLVKVRVFLGTYLTEETKAGLNVYLNSTIIAIKEINNFSEYNYPVRVVVDSKNNEYFYITYYLEYLICFENVTSNDGDFIVSLLVNDEILTDSFSYKINDNELILEK